MRFDRLGQVGVGLNVGVGDEADNLHRVTAAIVVVAERRDEAVRVRVVVPLIDDQSGDHRQSGLQERPHLCYG